jgi:hypothetical protein
VDLDGGSGAVPGLPAGDGAGAGERKASGESKLSLRLTDEVISKAVRETLAEQSGSPMLQNGKTLSGDAYKKFERAFRKRKSRAA